MIIKLKYMPIKLLIVLLFLVGSYTQILTIASISCGLSTQVLTSKGCFTNCSSSEYSNCPSSTSSNANSRYCGMTSTQKFISFSSEC